MSRVVLALTMAMLIARPAGICICHAAAPAPPRIQEHTCCDENACHDEAETPETPTPDHEDRDEPCPCSRHFPVIVPNGGILSVITHQLDPMGVALDVQPMMPIDSPSGPSESRVSHTSLRSLPLTLCALRI